MGTDGMEPVLPDGCMELVVHRGAPFRRKSDAGFIQQPPAFFVGQILSPLLLQPAGPIDVFGVRFTPPGFTRATGRPAGDMRGMFVGPSDLLGPAGTRCEDKILHASTLQEMIDAVESTLSPGESSPLVARAEQSIRDAGGLVPVTHIARELGASLRHLERSFLEQVGLTPKQYSRIIRFQNLFSCMESHRNHPWTSTAHELGYADQAHFVREFARFSGKSPTAFFREPHELSDHFTSHGRMSHLFKTF